MAPEDGARAATFSFLCFLLKNALDSAARTGLHFEPSASSLFTACAKRETAVEAGTRALLLGNGPEPRDLDPHLASASTQMNIFVALFEGLTFLESCFIWAIRNTEAFHGQRITELTQGAWSHGPGT